MNATAAALRLAAAAFRNGHIKWGVGFFRDPFKPGKHCCALGGIAHAVDPDDLDGDPRWVHPDLRPISTAAAHQLADYLVTELGAADKGSRSRHEGWVRDPIETVGDWNDEPGRSVAEVVAALEAAADRADARTAASA